MSAFSIRNPYFIIVCALMIAVVGVTVISRMPVDMFPALNLTTVVITTFYPGMPPEHIDIVCDQIEAALRQPEVATPRNAF